MARPSPNKDSSNPSSRSTMDCTTDYTTNSTTGYTTNCSRTSANTMTSDTANASHKNHTRTDRPSNYIATDNRSRRNAAYGASIQTRRQRHRNSVPSPTSSLLSSRAPKDRTYRHPSQTLSRLCFAFSEQSTCRHHPEPPSGVTLSRQLLPITICVSY